MWAAAVSLDQSEKPRTSGGLCSLRSLQWCRRGDVPFTEAAQQVGDGQAVIQDTDAADGQTAQWFA